MKRFVFVMSWILMVFMAGMLWAGEDKFGARQTGLYVSLMPSAVFPLSVETTSPGLTPAETRTKWGVGIDGGLGYRFGDFRVEGKILYGRSSMDDIRFVGGGGALSGYYDWWGGTMNVFYDIPTGIRLRPYVGAGVGAVRFTAHDVTLAGFPPTGGRNNLFVCQFMAGISYALADAWRIMFGYRLLEISGPDFETGGVSLYGKSFRMHTAQTGVQYDF